MSERDDHRCGTCRHWERHTDKRVYAYTANWCAAPLPTGTPDSIRLSYSQPARKYMTRDEGKTCTAWERRTKHSRRGRTTMADRAVLLALADRCEQEYPNASLDAAISTAVDPIKARQEGAGWPDYTTSLDAAVTLVPSDAQEVVIRIYPNGSYARVTEGEAWHVRVHSSQVSTHGPALALCSAALRAIAAREDA